MKRFQLLVLIILLSTNVFGQINLNDSTAQAIGYWDKNEKQSYIVTQESYKIKDSDTTSREFFKYAVDITIVDSTANSYIIDWYYKDYEFKSDNPIMQKLATITDNVHIRIRTNELGVFQEIINWEHVRDYILKGIKMVKDETKEIPNFENFVTQLEALYSTKESIELGAVKEMQQFYAFHGGKYKYGDEYKVDLKMHNMQGGEPFDTKVTVWLDEIDSENNNFIMRTEQVVDSKQLTNSTFEYLTKMAETLKIPPPKRDELPEISNTIWIASRIHGTGWIVYSVETRETKAEGVTKIEERIIEIQ
jgi:hypothetical protein